MATERARARDVPPRAGTAPDPSPGRDVSPAVDAAPRTIGRYVLLRRIARGGMGEVFLASTMGVEGAERPVVVKVIRREHVKDPSFLARFLDEARVQSQLQHSGVAQVLEAVIDDATGEPYAVVEHVEGRSLGDVRTRLLQTGRAIAWADAAAVATLIAEALSHVHERTDPSGRALAIVHRDLSPQNVMVSCTGDVKIIDFGTARGQNRRCHTVSGVVFAKPGYVAPEVANGDSGDARVDLYALGVMLWELCKGARFLQGDANEHMAAVGRNAKNPPPIAEAVGAPVELDAIIAKLTAFKLGARYAAARTAATDLARLLSAAPALPSGERGVRARTAELMRSLFPNEPADSRREFQRLVASVGKEYRASKAPSNPPPRTEVPRKQAEAAAAEPPKPIALDEPGSLLPGTRYKLVRAIGKGTSSTVFEAEHVDLARRVALKVLAMDASQSPEFAARFRREAHALSRLYHDNLVAISDVGVTTDGRLYCVMERLEGETLEAYLAREKGVDWREALGIAERALGALEVAHGANIVHRDVKPANLFLTDPFGLKLLDFGIALAPGEVGEQEARKGEAIALFGTPEYMAPEQASSGAVDARADLYALGCVMYEMLTGRLPFVGKGAVAILDAKGKGSPESLRERAPSRRIPEPVDRLVLKALARHPSERFQTAAQMRRAIIVALDEPERRRGRRRMVGFAALGASMMIAAAVFAGQIPDLRGRLPWGDAQHALAVAPAPPEASDEETQEETPDPLATSDLPWARAERGEEPFDDALPPPLVVAAAAPTETAEPPAEEAPPRHLRKRRHDPKKHGVSKYSPPAASSATGDDDAPPAVAKKKKKKKTRMAHVE